MKERMKRFEENAKTLSTAPVRDHKLPASGKYDAEIGAIEVPDEIPKALNDIDTKITATATAEGVVGSVSDPDKDPMNVDKKY